MIQARLRFPVGTITVRGCCEIVSNWQKKAPLLASARSGAQFVTSGDAQLVRGGRTLTRLRNVFKGADLESWARLAHGAAIR